MSLAAQMPPISGYLARKASVTATAFVRSHSAVWSASSSMSGILGECLLQPVEALDGGHVGQQALQRHDLALAAHRLEQLLGDVVAGRDTVDAHVADPVRIVVPRMQVIGLVPLGDEVDARGLAHVGDRLGVGGLVGVDVEDDVLAALLDEGLHHGELLFAVTFAEQSAVALALALRLGVEAAAAVPHGVILVRERADHVGHVDRGNLLLHGLLDHLGHDLLHDLRCGGRSRRGRRRRHASGSSGSKRRAVPRRTSRISCG